MRLREGACMHHACMPVCACTFVCACVQVSGCVHECVTVRCKSLTLKGLVLHYACNAIPGVLELCYDCLKLLLYKCQ